MSAPALDVITRRRIRQDVLAMQAYAVQDAAGMVKLDAMENPHSLPPHLQEALGRRLGYLALNRYPDARINTLRTALAEFADMPPGWSLMLGNGSDELISLLAMACALPVATGEVRPVVLAPVPGFVMYAMSARLQGLEFVGVPLTAAFELDAPAMVASIEQHQPALVYLAYPNNPTANLWDGDAMARVVAAASATGSIVVLDEAYQPFSSHTYLDAVRADLQGHAHVLVMRTLSKFGLAGVRLGYLMGRSELIEQIDKVRPPYNISVLNCECALFALEHRDEFAAQALNIRAQRAMLLEALQGMQGVTAFASEANMVLVRINATGPPGVSGEEDRAARVFARMQSMGVLVKNISTMHPLLAQCLRLTVGTAEENRRMLSALQASL